MHPRPAGAGQQKGHARKQALERPFQRMQRNLHGRIFPQQNMMLEKRPGLVSSSYRAGTNSPSM